MKKIYLLAFIFLFFVSNPSFSQVKDQYEKGTVTLNNDEVISGFIKVESLSKLGKGVCFKQSETDKKCLNYDISQIKSFTTENGKNFELLIFEMEGLEIAIFANLLLKGHASLYEGCTKGCLIQLIYILSEKMIQIIFCKKIDLFRVMR